MRFNRLKKCFCLLVFLCLGLKNISYALQPFAAPTPGFFSETEFKNEEGDMCLLHTVASLVNMELNGEGEEIFYYRIDKQRPNAPSFRCINFAEYRTEDVLQQNTARQLKRLTDSSRKFSVPAHYHFLFRLTPF